MIWEKRTKVLQRESAPLRSEMEAMMSTWSRRPQLELVSSERRELKQPPSVTLLSHPLRGSTIFCLPMADNSEQGLQTISDLIYLRIWYIWPATCTATSLMDSAEWWRMTFSTSLSTWFSTPHFKLDLCKLLMKICPQLRWHIKETLLEAMRLLLGTPQREGELNLVSLSLTERNIASWLEWASTPTAAPTTWAICSSTSRRERGTTSTNAS